MAEQKMTVPEKMLSKVNGTVFFLITNYMETFVFMCGFAVRVLLFPCTH